MIKFGTDGIREKADFFDEERLKRIACGIVASGGNRVIVGRDTRLSGERMASTLVDRLSGFGAEVITVGVVPTPALAFLTSLNKCDCGVMISASHNPPDYNGIKLFDKNGQKITVAKEQEIEELMQNEADISGEKRSVIDKKCAVESYVSYIKGVVGRDLKGMKILLDTCYGATSHVAPRVFRDLQATVVCNNGFFDGSRINVGCGATHPEYLLREVEESGADIGFAYDGDGDRLICVTGGKIRTGDDILLFLSRALKEEGLLANNAVVGTVMTNKGAEIAFNNDGIKFYRAPVGDRNVYEAMQKEGACLGGENSGHVILSTCAGTGDGVLISVLIAGLIKSGAKFVDYRVFPSYDAEVYADEIKKAKFLRLDNVDFCEGDKFRTVVRPSGTEPKIRITVEGERYDLVKAKAEDIKEYLERVL